MEDRISELSNDILSCILTVFSMKDLLKTSILSKRWSNLWSLRRDLYFDIYNVLGSDEELIKNGYLIDVSSKHLNLAMSRDEFIKRVEQFLKNFSNTKIDSFLVNFPLTYEYTSTIDQWISFAIARGVEKIDLHFLGSPFEPIPYPCPSKRYKFSFELFSKNNVSNLKYLCLEYCLLGHPTICDDFELFNNLRSLSLLEVKVDEVFIESLLSNCQLLEELCLVCCEFKSSLPKIVSSSLCHLKVSNSYKVSNNAMIRENLMLIVDCLKLTSLEYHEGELKSLHTLNIINTGVLKNIAFTILFEEYLDAIALCATFPELEIMRLVIYHRVTDSLKTAPLKITRSFNHLKQLDFIICFPMNPFINEEEYHLMWILNIFKASPLLEKLSVMIPVPTLFQKQKDIRDVEVSFHDKIKVIEFGGFIGNWFEIEFIMNVLKYAHKLEQMVVSPYAEGEYDFSEWSSQPESFQTDSREKIREMFQGEDIVRREKLVFL